MIVGYLDFDEQILGSSVDANHENWIEVISFSHSLVRNSPHAGPSSEPPYETRLQVGHIQIQKHFDCSTPKILTAICEQTIFPRATINLVRNSENSQGSIFYQIVLTNASIVNYGGHGSAMSGAANLMEDFSIDFEKIKWVYLPMDETGESLEPINGGWNLIDQCAHG